MIAMMMEINKKKVVVMLVMMVMIKVQPQVKNLKACKRKMKVMLRSRMIREK